MFFNFKSRQIRYREELLRRGDLIPPPNASSRVERGDLIFMVQEIATFTSFIRNDKFVGIVVTKKFRCKMTSSRGAFAACHVVALAKTGRGDLIFSNPYLAYKR